MLPSPHSYVTRGHDLRLQKNRARYDMRNFFSLRRKKNIVVSGNMDKKNWVGRSVFFFYNGASKYTKLLHTFLSLLSSSYIVL